MPTFNSTNGNDLQDTGCSTTLYGGDGDDRLKSDLAGSLHLTSMAGVATTVIGLG